MGWFALPRSEAALYLFVVSNPFSTALLYSEKGRRTARVQWLLSEFYGSLLCQCLLSSRSGLLHGSGDDCLAMPVQVQYMIMCSLGALIECASRSTLTVLFTKRPTG